MEPTRRHTDSEPIPDRLSELEEYVRESEDRVDDLIPEARARIVWAGDRKRKTSCSLVYLHGFRATHQEGDPTHFRVARSMGYNLYLSRHEGHGRRQDLPFQQLVTDDLTRSARKAIEIGLRLGERVILMGTSTGGSMALWLAGLPEYRDRIQALVLYAPLINFYGWPSLLKHSLPRNLLRLVPGPRHRLRADPGSEKESLIWYSEYALQGVLALGSFIQKQMTRGNFQRVSCPVFTGYYEGDRVVSVPAMRKMHRQLGTAPGRRVLLNFPAAGTHVICSGLLSGSVDVVVETTEQFVNVYGV